MSRAAALHIAAPVLLALAAAAGAGCPATPAGGPEAAGVKATYSKSTGKLELITYDTNKDGRVDAWSHMDGTRLVWMEIDRNFDGTPDRWEYYRPDGSLEKVGFSRTNGDKPDAWAYQGADGRMARMDVDSDHDGKVDRWETYSFGALASVELDTDRDGKPDRRLTYGPDGVKAEKLR